MSTLAIVEVVLREAGVPLTARDIVALAGSRLPSRSKTPDTVVARDLSVHIKRLGDASLFVRTAPGLFTLRELQHAPVDASLLELRDYLGNGAPKPTARATSTSVPAVGQSVMLGSA
ncbi:MAG: winged helix-turn-helix domain-containing protein [Myxococcales bacterium]|nr:winged helix-turn-helix domain-containing protein [Myxococcales bacterium]